MNKIGLVTPKGYTVKNIKEARIAIKEIGYPVILRPSFNKTFIKMWSDFFEDPSEVMNGFLSSNLQL